MDNWYFSEREGSLVFSDRFCREVDFGRFVLRTTEFEYTAEFELNAPTKTQFLSKDTIKLMFLQHHA